jgi:hypothetical protein
LGKVQWLEHLSLLFLELLLGLIHLEIHLMLGEYVEGIPKLVVMSPV